MNLSSTTAILAAGVMFVTPALGQTVLVDDHFADGSPHNSGAAGETQFFNTSASLALDNSAAGDAAGSLEFATGRSGRAIHTVFPTRMLAQIDDTLHARVSFTTPATVGRDENNGLRLGLFNQGGKNLAGDIEASKSHPNPILGDTGLRSRTRSDNGKITGKNRGLAGFSADYDVNDLSRDGTAQDQLVLRRSNVDKALGRLLTTTKGFDSLITVDAPNAVNGFVAEADYEVSLSVTRLNATDIQIHSVLVRDGAVLNSASVVAKADAFDFSVLGISATSDAFGSSSSCDDEDNGIRITHVNVEFESASAAASASADPDVFEPS